MLVSVKLRLRRVWVRGVLPIMAYTGRLRPKGVGITLVEVRERGGKSVIAVDERLKRANR